MPLIDMRGEPPSYVGTGFWELEEGFTDPDPMGIVTLESVGIEFFVLSAGLSEAWVSIKVNVLTIVEPSPWVKVVTVV